MSSGNDHIAAQVTLRLPYFTFAGQGVGSYLDQVLFVAAAGIYAQRIPWLIANGYTLVIVDAIAGQHVGHRGRGQHNTTLLVEADQVAVPGHLAANLIIVGTHINTHTLLPVAQRLITRPISAHVVCLDGIPSRQPTQNNNARAQVAADQVAGASTRSLVTHSTNDATPAIRHLYPVAEIGDGRRPGWIGAYVIPLDHTAGCVATLD